MSLLDIRDLHVWFELPRGGKLHAVQGLDLSVGEHERVGLVGESGCGKTTALLAVLGLLPATACVSGQVSWNGTNLLDAGEKAMRRLRWREIAIIFQNTMSALNPVQTIGAQIREPLAIHNIASGAAAGRRVADLLDMVGLAASTADRYPHELSGGMRQRAGVAMALACKPRLILADEPTTSLDVMVQAQILELLVELTHDTGLSLLLVTHDLPVVAEICDRAVVAYAGEAVESGTLEALRRDPRHPYTRRLIHATPGFAADRTVASIPGAPPRLDQPITGCPFQPRCDRAIDRCREERPVSRLVAPGRLAACHFADSVDIGHHAEHAPPPVITANPAPPPPGAPVLEAEGLAVHYRRRMSLLGALRHGPAERVRAVDGVSLTVRAGEFVALVGESGCGKTSTALAIVRLVDTAAGTISVEGEQIGNLPVRELRALRRRVQLVYQDPYEALDPRHRVRAIIEEPLRIHRLCPSQADRAQRVTHALERAGLTPPELYLDRYPHELSGGQRQRVAIAASLALSPTLLIADEPVSMLDVSTKAAVLATLDDLRRDGTSAVLIITHDLLTASHFADRIIVMYLGRIVEEGAAQDVLQRPAHPYTRALLSAVPRLDPAVRPPRQILSGETPDASAIPTGCRFHPRCPIAQTRCREVDPQLRQPANEAPGHRAACILV